jgi:hypothetical protein
MRHTSLCYYPETRQHTNLSRYLVNLFKIVRNEVDISSLQKKVHTKHPVCQFCMQLAAVVNVNQAAEERVSV